MAETQLKYLQLAGYCISLCGLYLIKRRKTAVLHNSFAYVLLVFLLITLLSRQFPRETLNSGLSTALPESLQEFSWTALETVPRPKEDLRSLPGFLQSRGVGVDKTVFVTIASEKYVQSTVNFKFSLDRWGLGRQFVVLCLDDDCVREAESHGIYAYNRYATDAKERSDNWRRAVARVKVLSNY